MMGPFTFPEGNIQICLSGGRTSARLLWELQSANPRTFTDQVRVIFTNTGREMPETLDFIHEIETHWDVEVIWLEYTPVKPWFKVVSYETAARDGEPFEAMIRKERYLPNQAQRICTKILKVLTAKRYLRSLGWKTWTSALGIRADEAHRAKPPKRGETWVNWYPLVDAGLTKRHMIAFWKAQNFDLRLPTVNGSCPDGNCDGCFLKSQAHLASLHRRRPDRAAWWARMESMASELLERPATFHKDFPRSELHDFIDRQADWIFNDEAYLCQASHGECTA